jgi:hypothetical protein
MIFPVVNSFVAYEFTLDVCLSKAAHVLVVVPKEKIFKLALSPGKHHCPPEGCALYTCSKWTKLHCAKAFLCEMQNAVVLLIVCM